MNVNARTKERRARLEAIEQELAQMKKRRRRLERALDAEAAEDLTELADREPAPEPAPVAAGEAPERDGAEPGEDRERFASYFMSGNLGRSGQQLRKERRALRNKALVMAVLAVILLVVLARFLIK